MFAQAHKACRSIAYAGLSLLLCLSLAPASPAFAADTATNDSIESSSVADSDVFASMRGMDTTEISGDSFDVATVLGLADRTLYCDVSVSGEVATQDLEYRYDDASDEAGVVQLKADVDYLLKHSGSVELDFYDRKSSERGGAAPLYSARVYAVTMVVDGSDLGSDSLIAIRTCDASDAAQPVQVPMLVYRNGQTYRVAGGTTPAVPALGDDGVLRVAYEPASSDGVDGSVTYVDEDGNTLRSDSVGKIASDQSQTVSIAQEVEASGSVYIPLSRTATITLTAQSPEAVVHCVKQQAADRTTTPVSISYECDGTALMNDRVQVGSGGYRYAPAKVFSQSRDGGVLYYALTGAIDSHGNTYTAEEASELALTYDGAPSYTLEYALVEDELLYTVNFAFVAPDDSGNLSVSIEDSRSASFTEKSPASIELPATIERDGWTYARAGSEDTLSYGWSDLATGRLASDTVYYTRSDVKAPAAYDVTIRYVDAVSGSELGSTSLACEPGGASLSIDGPESLEVDGKKYTRLGGQEAALTHRFYDPYRTYTIYYATDEDLAAGNVTVVRTVVVDGGVRRYIIDADGNVREGASAAASSASGNDNSTGSASGSDSATGGISASAPSTTIVSGSNNEDADGAGSVSGVIAPNGNTAEQERIQDEQNPLAGSTSSDDGIPFWCKAAVGAVLVLLLALRFMFMAKRRNSDEEA